MAAQWTAILGDEPATKRQVPAARISDDEKWRQLTLLGVKLGLKNAADLRVLAAVAYVCFLVPAECEPIIAAKDAILKHNERTKGVSKHTEGPPDGFALMALLLKVLVNDPQHPKKQEIEQFLSDHPPRSPQIQKVALCVRINDASDKKFKKIYLKLHWL